MNMMHLNIENLTSLWQVAGEAFHAYSNKEGVCISHIKNKGWPNRIWTNHLLNGDMIGQLKITMQNKRELTLSYFNEDKNNELLRTNTHFKHKSLQYGMSLPLVNSFDTKKAIEFRKVEERESAALWCESFHKSFSYDIGLETVIKTKDKIRYYLLYHEDILLGTVVLFITGKVAGIHSLGILPDQRKKGFATEIMHHLLNKCLTEQLEIATLQASQAAKEMYLKIGFSLDFFMENYILND